MRRLARLPLPLVAACAIVLALSAVAFAHGNNNSGNGPKHHGPRGGGATRGAIVVTEHADTDATTDTGASGDSAGDVLTFANPVFDAADRTQVATDQGYCIRTVAGSAYECNWTTFLPKGQLVVEGPFYDSKDSTLAITGGTGAYKNARGTMDLHAVNGGKEYTFTFHVVG
jgi:allene oxide cyclase